MTEKLKLWGFPVSPHVRAARITYSEKNLPVEFKEIGLDHVGTDEYFRINPFRQMPALTIDESNLYETPALMVYANDLGSGPDLIPQDPREKAKMWQFIGIAQNRLYKVGVLQLYFHNVLTKVFGMASDEKIAQDSVQPIVEALDVLEKNLKDGFIAGGKLSLADIYCGAMIDYVERTNAGRKAIHARPKVQLWLTSLRGRESFKATFAPMLKGTDQH